MTGCHNRRNFIALGESEVDRHLRYKTALSIIMLDIDKFKSINDTHGHAAGDEVIKILVKVCLQLLRKSDILGRLGGEEFAIVLPETQSPEAQIVAEKIRAALANTDVLYNEKIIYFTASFGIAKVEKDDKDIHEILNRADQALYMAKNAGRNNVVGPIVS